ncbi:3-keto-disaccharide hydrolase [Roseibacillus ishigakijimensis]|uniref:DUF1080 domain-containing protein n=1 Tax=Roseibacillus ishigakijimensis TaxID=454146 RepID=A0A934RQI6_9BACT|nr:DUF1080 domain-containing protein [Roseibacillus ishigakijimensis]MBK1834027.1 DUF1080 domain-containing protein [Roseibacillus ishigakijimensis]
MKKTIALLSLLPAGFLPAEHKIDTSKKQYPDAPTITGTPYSVHDTTRPQPRKVESAGAVAISAPSDAKVLFDGSNTEAWNGNWRVEDGILIASPGSLVTKESFGDCQVHLEFRVPADREVKGQQGGNSGIFLMGRYEVQVGESHSNQTYPDGQAGAVYGQTPPLVNPATPQGEWQSYDIIFKAPVYKDGKVSKPAEITVLFNGVVVQAGFKALGPTQHQKLASYPENHPEKAPISLQWHNDPIEYRNIWVRPLGEYDQQP